jgi:hypothetical protein
MDTNMNNFYVLKYDSSNLGDDIQSIATMDLLDEISIQYSFVYRDLINGYFFNPRTNNYIIFNGWFTNGYGMDTYYSVRDDIKSSIKTTWPPKGNFKPILYSFHISEWGPKENRQIHPSFLEDSLEFYKESKSVGCRDLHTLHILKQFDVNPYFSGCNTLTLNKSKYAKVNADKNMILLVDIPEKYKENLIQQTSKLYNGEVGFQNLTHNISPYSKDMIDRFSLAKKHLEAFANAKLVFTSRLHVALPCLAMGTPVILVIDETELDNSRFRDYIQYMNVITHQNIDVCDITEYLSNKYDGELSINIKNKFIKIIQDLL